MHNLCAWSAFVGPLGVALPNLANACANLSASPTRATKFHARCLPSEAHGLQGGAVLFDGLNVKDLRISWLRRQVRLPIMKELPIS
jgi:hypothetical protein